MTPSARSRTISTSGRPVRPGRHVAAAADCTASLVADLGADRTGPLHPPGYLRLLAPGSDRSDRARRGGHRPLASILHEGPSACWRAPSALIAGEIAMDELSCVLLHRPPQLQQRRIRREEVFDHVDVLFAPRDPVGHSPGWACRSGKSGRGRFRRVARTARPALSTPARCPRGPGPPVRNSLAVQPSTTLRPRGGLGDFLRSRPEREFPTSNYAQPICVTLCSRLRV